MESHRVPSVFLPPKKSAELLAALGYQVANDTVEQTKANKKVSGKVYLQVRQDKKFQALNVCAMLQGSSKKSEALVYSAHMDHVGMRMDSDPFNGADDNASGSAGIASNGNCVLRRQGATETLGHIPVGVRRRTRAVGLTALLRQSHLAPQKDHRQHQH